MIKRIFFRILFVLGFTIPRICFAALEATTVWELRAGATADNVNGGGFNSARDSVNGVDYSQQNAAQLALTNLAQVALSTTLTSVTGGFTHAMEGNIIHITSGTNFTAGWYEIVTWTDTNTVTIDRTAAATLDASAGVGKVGGAMSLGSSTAGSTDDNFFDVVVAGNKIWIKNGSYTLEVTVSSANAGATANPIVVEGYYATRGDIPTGADRPTIAGGAYGFTVASYWDVNNIIFTGTITNLVTAGANGKIVNCKIVNSSTTPGRTALYGLTADILILNNELISYRGIAFYMNYGGPYQIMGNYIHNSDIGIKILGTGGTILNNIIESNVTAAIQYQGGTTVSQWVAGNTLYGSENTTGIGINIPTGLTEMRVVNNIIYGFATGVSHVDTQSVSYDNYNDYYNNDADVSAAGQWQKGANDQALAPSFTNVGQYTGTNATSTTNVLTDTNATFTNVVNNQDFVYISAGSGTGIGLYNYLITAHTPTTLTVSSNITSSGDGTGLAYQITTGRNFTIGTNLKAKGFPGAFQAGLTTGYMDIGGVQRQEPAGGGGEISYGYTN